MLILLKIMDNKISEHVNILSKTPQDAVKEGPNQMEREDPKKKLTLILSCMVLTPSLPHHGGTFYTRQKVSSKF